MQQGRREADRKSVQILGWIACGVLSASLLYVFVRSLKEGAGEVDPWFLAMQVGASALFLVYSLRLKNKAFVTANAMAILSAVGTLVLKAMEQ